MTTDLLELPRISLMGNVPSGGRVIELGVASGSFTEELANYRDDVGAKEPAQVWGVDRWDDGTSHDEFEMLFAQRRLRDHANARLIRTDFKLATQIFPIEYFDLVYVDGYAHTGQEDGRTLTDWWPLVKVGGVFAMHDYCERWQPAMNAWDRFMGKQNIDHQYLLTADEYPTVFVYKKEESWK